MGNCFKTNPNTFDKLEKKRDIVKHRSANENRVSEEEMQLAELKGRINKIK